MTDGYNLFGLYNELHAVVEGGLRYLTIEGGPSESPCININYVAKHCIVILCVYSCAYMHVTHLWTRLVSGGQTLFCTWALLFTI